MPEDFEINYSCASQWNGSGYCLLKEPPRERVDALTLYLGQLLQSHTHPGEKHHCPVCGQELMLAFEYYVELPNELDIVSECSTCNINVFFKSNKIPPWARAVSLFDLPHFFDRSNHA